MAGQGGRSRPRSQRDQRRRSAGQNFLVDRRLVRRIVEGLEIAPGELVVDLGAGTGALTLAVAAAGADVIAIEHDPQWAARLRERVASQGLGARVSVIEADFMSCSMPVEPFRVIANPPFRSSTDVLRLLLDDPASGPYRCDLILQAQVVRKRTTCPPNDLRTAGWSPWWRFEAGPFVHRSAFRPVPAVDASVLTVRRRDHPVLPEWLGPNFIDVLRPAWERRHR